MRKIYGSLLLLSFLKKAKYIYILPTLTIMDNKDQTLTQRLRAANTKLLVNSDEAGKF